MKRLTIAVVAVLTILAASISAAPQGPPSAEEEIPFFGGDPAGDGINACTADDCRVCNNNGLMCTPTSTGCNCEYWPSEQ